MWTHAQACVWRSIRLQYWVLVVQHGTPCFTFIIEKTNCWFFCQIRNICSQFSYFQTSDVNRCLRPSCNRLGFYAKKNFFWTVSMEFLRLFRFCFGRFGDQVYTVHTVCTCCVQTRLHQCRVLHMVGTGEMFAFFHLPPSLNLPLARVWYTTIRTLACVLC